VLSSRVLRSPPLQSRSWPAVPRPRWGRSSRLCPVPASRLRYSRPISRLAKRLLLTRSRGRSRASNQTAVGTAALTTVAGAGLGAAAGSLAGAAGTGAAIGAGLGAGGGMAIGASNSSNDQRGIQARYDSAYAQCMIARGEQVPGYGPAGYDPVRFAEPAPMAAPLPQPDPLVRATQTGLVRLGYLGDAADGFAGPKTHAAISAYQQANAWPVDGAPSPRLLARLQATPTAAAAPGGWVAPASASVSVPPTASAPGGWVAPAAAPTAAPLSTATPAVPASWVAPARSP
jgi:hypothetical protein